jgi:hypothetical protein
MSRFIGQSLTGDTPKRNLSAFGVVDAKFGAGVHPEIKFGQVPREMAVIHVLINTHKTAFEDAEKTFKGIGVNVAARPFKLGMIHGFMLEHPTFVGIGAIGHQAAVFMQMMDQGHTDVLIVQVHGTDRTSAFDQAEHLDAAFGIQRAALASLRGLGKESFISFDGLASAAQHAAVVLHGFPDSMPQEPSGFHAAIKHPLNLTGADAFFAGAHQVDDLQPQMQRQVTGFEDGAHAYSERLLAAIALAKAWSSGLAIQAAHAITATAMRAYRAIWPQMRLDIREGSGFVLELRGGKDGGCHG